MNSTPGTEKQALVDRIAYLEENRRFFQNALEMVLDLGDLQESVKKEDGERHLLENAVNRISNIIPFSAGAIYTIDPDTWEFVLSFCTPTAKMTAIQEEVEFMIDKGFFAWAVRERRGVLITSKDQSRQFVLHMIATYSEIMGMFVGLLPKKSHSLPDTSLSLLSVILLNAANALESIQFRKFLKNQNIILEKKVEERTRELTLSQEKLQASMEEANRLALDAEAANKAKSLFLANMSHEIRTPMNAIIGILELLQSSVLNHHQRTLFSTINTEAEALLGIINNILDFSKLEEHRLELEEIPFHLREMLEDIANAMVIKAEQKGLELFLYLPPQSPAEIVGDLTKLRQVLINLVGNAVKFTHTGEVGIWVEPIKEEAARVIYRFEVRDTGIGIPSEKHEMIFERFTQADESTTRKYGGTGLGTAICKQIIELMGGRIGVESRQNIGSTFWFEVGFNRQPADAAAVTSNSSELKETPVLVVDDKPSQCTILNRYLTHWGCRITCAGTEAEAVRLLGQKKHAGAPFRLIVMDRFPAEASGFDIADRLRNSENAANIPIILLTSLMSPEEPGLCDRIPLVGAVNKPIREKDLFNAVQSILGHIGDSALRQSAAAPDPATAAKVNRRAIRILLVEDYPTNQQIAMAHLRGAGYRVDLAENGQQAVTAFKQHPYDLVMMDIQMPVMDGYEATRRIREMESDRAAAPSSTGQGPNGDRRTPIIAMTAHAVKGYREKCLRAGMDDYITKPLKRHRLLAMVEKWAPEKRVRRIDDTPSVEPRPAASPSRTDTAIQLKVALAEFQGDKALLKEVILGFKENVRIQIDTIRKAIADNNAEQVRREAHAIKGGAANLTALPLSKAAADLENLGKSGNLEKGVPVLEKLVKEFHRLEADVRGV